MELVDRCFDCHPTTACHRPTARATWSCGTTLNRTGSPHAVQPSVRDHTSERPKAQRPPRKFLGQFFPSLKSPGRYSKKKAKKRTGFNKRPRTPRARGIPSGRIKRFSLPVRKNSCNFRDWRYIASVFLGLLSLCLFADLICMQFPPSPPSKVSARGGSANRPWLLYQPDSLFFICPSS